MTRADFQAASFDYRPPTGDPLRWRMDDVRVNRYGCCPVGLQLYALWPVGEASYMLTSPLDVHDAQAIVAWLPMRDPLRLRLPTDAFLNTHHHPIGE